jgi:hypothetical protein
LSVKTTAIVALITALVGGTISEIYATFKPVSLIINFLQHPVILKVWGLILITIALPLITLIIFSITKIKTSDPDHYTYTTDIIKGLRWQWRWSSNGILNLVALCPTCSYQPTIKYSPYFGSNECEYICDHCGYKQAFQIPYTEVESQVTREIYLKVKNGKYLSAVNQT